MIASDELQSILTIIMRTLNAMQADVAAIRKDVAVIRSWCEAEEEEEPAKTLDGDHAGAARDQTQSL